jgi:hypothetical protein
VRITRKQERLATAPDVDRRGPLAWAGLSLHPDREPARAASHREPRAHFETEYVRPGPVEPPCSGLLQSKMPDGGAEKRGGRLTRCGSSGEIQAIVP